MKVAINVAGSTLAYSLLHFGHEPVLVEEAPRLREGGYVIDSWGIRTKQKLAADFVSSFAPASRLGIVLR